MGDNVKKKMHRANSTFAIAALSALAAQAMAQEQVTLDTVTVVGSPST